MLRLALALLVLISASATALAQTCSFSVTNVNFGNVDTLAGASVDTTATVGITCGGALLGANMRICLNLNAGSGGATAGIRHLRNALSEPLNYNFYQDPARSTPWGSVEQPALGNPVAVDLTLPVLGGSVSTTRTIYARVLGSQQTVGPGTYTSIFSGAQVRFNYVTYGGAPPACAGVASNPTRPTFTASASVLANCRVTAQNINFGSQGVLDTQVDAIGGLGVTCTSETAYTVGLNGGLSGAPPTARRMTLGSQAVIYGLYKDAARSQPWGNAGGDLVAGSGAGTTQNLPVYGRVAPQPTPSPGTYTDTVVVTVTY